MILNKLTSITSIRMSYYKIVLTRLIFSLISVLTTYSNQLRATINLIQLLNPTKQF
ncbi:hypothetical protein SAMN02927903_01109 [Flavobacterium caeni]|uniref:Uncharacterized protein n=1 Tax=Flavobacterium caeni TaxID=490189 RepID=A0A1G5EP74_9FLAO|nr:hypothetical protein SAMN02927903_01109 [Flavobacterium caeni]